MSDMIPMQGRFIDTATNQPSDEEGLATPPIDPLALDIEDDELVDSIDKRQEDIKHYYTEKNLYDRREKLEMYYFGRQILEQEKEKLIKNYESRFQDNLLYEIAANLKPLAMSRLPDLIVTPGNDSEQSRLMAQEISKAVDSDTKSRQNRKVLGLAFKHLPVYFTGVLKARWDNEMDDYVFECIHPSMIDVDYTCPSNNAEDMDYISQITPMTVQQMIMRFPDKEEDIIKELSKDGLEVKNEKPTFKALATVVKPREVWFKWYKKHADKKYEPIWGVLWKYHDVILAKMKNPNFDYEGEQTTFIYDEKGNKRVPNNDEMTQAVIQTMLSGTMPSNIKDEKVYHNYLKRPPMPYFFLGYDQWGKQPLDETSWMEQNVKNQEALDKRGKQIDETLDNRGHHIISKESGLKAADIQGMDFSDPDQDLLVDGNVNDVHAYIAPLRPDQAEFNDLDRIRQRMHELAGDNAVGGQIQSDVATTNQIARESNFTRADDLVEDTINAASEWMARMALHFIKLRYTEDHFKEIMGIAGAVVYSKLNRNMVDEGMQVMIKASGTDRLQAKNNAIDLAKLQMIDPVNFFRDMGYPDYEERAQMMMTFKTDLSTYLVKYVENLQTSAEMAAALEKSPEQEMQVGNPSPQGLIPAPQQPGIVGGLPEQAPGMIPGAQPQGSTPTNTAAAPMTPPQGPPQGSPRMLG